MMNHRLWSAVAIAFCLQLDFLSDTVRAERLTESPPAGVTVYRQGSWWVASSRNFHICSRRGADEAKTTACTCEQLRDQLLTLLGFESAPAAWNPKCHVVLYPTVDSYVATVGPGAEVTVGSSLVEPPRGSILVRRIDLRTDVANFLEAALPHELCHLLVADRYRDEPAPLWYDEGLALLMDPAEKLARHERDLQRGIQQGLAFGAAALLRARSYPSPERMAVFYGQCASLTHFLLEQGSPRQMHEFVAQSRAVGLNLAVRDVYGLSGVAELERQWLARPETPVGPMEVSALSAFKRRQRLQLSVVAN